MEETFHSCAQFEPNMRPTASEVFFMLTDDLVASLVVKNLNVSQNSALEIADSKFTAEIERLCVFGNGNRRHVFAES